MSHGTASNRTNRRPHGAQGLAQNAAFTGTRADTSVRVVGVELYFLPVQARMPLKFGSETLTSVTCARARVTVQDAQGRTATGWGETPLNVEWVWPSDTPYSDRYRVTLDFCTRLANRWADFSLSGHPIEIGHAFQHTALEEEIAKAHEGVAEDLKIPLLAGLLCCSPFDIAVYDAYGNLHGRPAMETLSKDFCGSDLATFLESDTVDVNFRGQYVSDYLRKARLDSLPAWHLVGGLDPLSPDQIQGEAINDGHPVVLSDWIDRDGLQCLKVKLRGVDYDWDYDRLVSVGRLGHERGVKYITADFNCMVADPGYVVDMMDRLSAEEPNIYESLLYIEQPFPYDLEKHQIDVREVSARKPLLMDESAHNWELVRLGRTLGWNGVALKTCKTLTGALLSLCWAKAHGMSLMVQDLTNPMLAQIPHVTLAAYTDTMMGVETNAMQFYPDASNIEAKVHPGLYRRSEGHIDLSSVGATGFGYRTEEIGRELPAPAVTRAPKTKDAAPPSPHMELPNDPSS